MARNAIVFRADPPPFFPRHHRPHWIGLGDNGKGQMNQRDMEPVPKFSGSISFGAR
jgi:hypothetical protein